MTRHKTLITYLVAYSLALGVILRYLAYLRSLPSWWTIVGLLAIFLLLLAIEPWISRRSHRYTHLYLLVQIGILTVLSIMTTIEDFFAVPFMSLSLQAMHVFPPRIGFRWIGIFIVLTAILLVSIGMTFHGMSWGASLPNVLIYATAYLLVGSFMTVIRQLEDAREESQGLLTELQGAHEQLQAYTTQAEELAVIAERNRLARDLHDSVTQSLYSLTLFTQAARELAEAGNLERTRHNLARIADTAGQTLKEMRLLVYELRPLALTDVRLVEAVQHRLDAVEGRSGVQARLLLEAEGDIELPATVEEELYRIAQEALNNALKHAHATSVTVRIVVPANGRRLKFEVSDDGCGFDLDAAKGKGGLGLTSIRERADRLGAELSVSSTLGQGTQIKIEMEVTP